MRGSETEGVEKGDREHLPGLEGPAAGHLPARRQEGLGKGEGSAVEYKNRRGVAQPGRALGSGPRGRRFKSFRPDQHIARIGQFSLAFSFVRIRHEATPHRLTLAVVSALAARRVETLADLLRVFNYQQGVRVADKPFCNRVARPDFEASVRSTCVRGMQDCRPMCASAAVRLGGCPPEGARLAHAITWETPAGARLGGGHPRPFALANVEPLRPREVRPSCAVVTSDRR